MWPKVITSQSDHIKFPEQFSERISEQITKRPSREDDDGDSVTAHLRRMKKKRCFLRYRPVLQDFGVQKHHSKK